MLKKKHKILSNRQAQRTLPYQSKSIDTLHITDSTHTSDKENIKKELIHPHCNTKSTPSKIRGYLSDISKESNSTD